ncbi:P-loop containing nucleoside triphosphate hydrolase protein, partial [Obba rivulosa]
MSAHNATSLSTPAAPQALPTDLLALLTTMVSMGALGDWFKLFVIGGAIETCRRYLFRWWNTFLESFWLTASFSDGDDSYNWVMFWLSKHPSWKKARTIEVSTRTFGLNSPVVPVLGEDEDSASTRRMSLLPSKDATYSTWYRRRYMWISRSEERQHTYWTKDTLTISFLTRDHDILNKFLLECRKTYMEAEEGLISIYTASTSNEWRHMASRPKRPMNSIILDPGVKDLLLDDARDFLNSKSWYADRGIPFRRGYLLYGAPGTGKTSIIQSLAGELELDVYIVSLSRMGLDDASLSELISGLPERCIVLMEDIDAAFHRGVKRKMEQPKDTPGEKEEDDKPPGKDEETFTSRVTLSGLLNALDGVGAQEGRLLFATTNCYTALDPALCRPGRMDLHLEFKLASRYQAHELFKRFYMPTKAGSDDASLSETKEGDRSPSPSSSECDLPPVGDLIDLRPPTPDPSEPSDDSEKP